MRTVVYVSDPFGRDIGWITQEVIEDYAGSLLRGAMAAQYCVQKWTRGDLLKINAFMELVASHPDIQLVQDDLVDEMGIEHFTGRPKPKEFHIRQLEMEIERARSSDKAALYKELRELQGWTTKPAEKNVVVSVNNVNSSPQLDRDNPREAERVVMSVFGSI